MRFSFDIIILTTPKKRCLVKDRLEGMSYKIYENRDWPIPPAVDWHASAYEMEPRQEIAYNIFRGHQECMNLIEKEYALILEDDAVPRGHWITGIQEGIELLTHQWEIVALYGRAVRWINHSFQHANRTYLAPGKHPRWGIGWTNGAVAYLLNKSTAERVSKDPYRGAPYDLHLVENYRFCVPTEDQQSFDHTLDAGSHFHQPVAP